MADTSTAVILEGPGRIAVREIPVPSVGEPCERVFLGACGICGSDVRYLAGENPWAMHTLGHHVDSPPNMVLGHEVAGTRQSDGARVAILAYKACGVCEYCRTGRENLCVAMEHFGHSAGWGERQYYPGGMSRKFDIWKGFAYPLPDAVSFAAATFLDGLAVAVHAVDMANVGAGNNLAVVGLGPIGMLAAQVARARGAQVTGCDTGEVPVRLAAEVGVRGAVHGTAADLGTKRVLPSGSNSASGAPVSSVGASASKQFDAVIDTVGSAASISDGLKLLAASGRLVMLAVHPDPVPLPLTALSSERLLLTSANNRYDDFPRAIDLLSRGDVLVEPLVTHRFPIDRAPEAFQIMSQKDEHDAFKVLIEP